MAPESCHGRGSFEFARCALQNLRVDPLEFLIPIQKKKRGWDGDVARMYHNGISKKVYHMNILNIHIDIYKCTSINMCVYIYTAEETGVGWRCAEDIIHI